jgi:3-phosphoshikimate 1-carboxyvinyltransferase
VVTLVEMANQIFSRWAAPTTSGALNAVVELPGSKSLTNRELVLATIATEPTSFKGALVSRDSTLMLDALSVLGSKVSGAGTTSPMISPARLSESARIDCGLAGTVMRFVPPLATLNSGRITFDGDEGARRRPMDTTITSLRSLGVEIEAESLSLPFTVVGKGQVRGGDLTIDASSSSQFVSGLLLVAPRFENGLTLRHVGPTLPSLPHIEMTLECLRQRGVAVSSPETSVWRVEPGAISGGSKRIEPDLSNAGPFLAAAMVVGGSVTIPDWPNLTTQVGDAFDGILQQMGANIVRDDRGLTITGSGEIHGIDIDLSIGGELAQVVAALAVLADSPSRITGISHIRGHETDRLAAMATEINRIGGNAEETEDGWIINPSNKLHGGLWHSYEDHRMATAGAIIGLRVPGIEVENIETTSKTMPNFAEMWLQMLGVNE